MQRSSEQDAGMATKTGLWRVGGCVGGVKAGEMSLNNIKSPPSSETGSKLLHAQTNRQIDLSEHLSALIKSYSTQPPHFQDHTTALRLGLWGVGGWCRVGVCVSMCVCKNVMHNFFFLVPKFSVFLQRRTHL